MAVSPDVIVIGSGIVGCATAYELGRRGATVLVVDDRRPGMGATQASAGMLAPYNEVDAEGPHLDLTVRALALFEGFLARVASEIGATIPYRRSGTLTLAFNRETLDRLERLAALMKARGEAADLIDAAEVRREEPAVSPAAVGGLIIPAHGYVAAGALTGALVAAAQRHGVRFEEGPRRYEIRQQGSGVVVGTGQGALVAAQAVIAAGSWAGQIRVAGANRPAPVHPVRGQLLHLTATGHNLRRVTWSDRCYLVPWDDGSLLVGATVEQVGFDEDTTVGGMSDLLGGLTDALQPGWPATIVGVRAGLRPGTPDDLPIIGRSAAAPAVIYATGHFRNGVLLAPITAILVADAMLDGRVDPIMSATSPARFGGL